MALAAPVSSDDLCQMVGRLFIEKTSEIKALNAYIQEKDSQLEAAATAINQLQTALADANERLKQANTPVNPA